MFRRLILSSISLLSILLLFGVAAAQRSGSATRADVFIKVLSADEHPAPEHCRVQLFTNGRMPVAERFTDDRGSVAFGGIGAGNYELIISSPEIENSEITFTINTRETAHYEDVHVKLKQKEATSTQATISTATLNIPDKARKEFDKGLTAFNKQDLPTAREHFVKAADIYPQYCAAYMNLGVIAMKNSDARGGHAYFQRAVEADPQNSTAYIYLARVEMMDANYPEAQTLLTKALSIAPLDAELLTMLATNELRSGKYQDAVSHAKKVHTVPHADYPGAHLVAAEALMKENLPDSAAEEYRLFLKESPDGPKAASARAALQSIEDRPK